VLPNDRLTVSQRRGKVGADDVLELEVSLCCSLPGAFASTLEVEVRGGKPLKLPVKADAVIPVVSTKVQPSTMLRLLALPCSPLPALLCCFPRHQTLATKPSVQLLGCRIPYRLYDSAWQLQATASGSSTPA
jgi:hypothetical protein